MFISILITILVTFASQTWLQAIHILKHRKDTQLLRGVSIFGLTTTIMSEFLWIAYAGHYHLIGGLTNACLSLLSVAVILAVLLHQDLIAPLPAVLLALTALVTLATVYYAPFTLTVILATVFATIFLLPQTIKTIMSIGTPRIHGMSNQAITMIICANTAWIIYGIYYHAWAYLISSTILLLCGIIMAGAKYYHKHNYNQKGKVVKNNA